MVALNCSYLFGKPVHFRRHLRSREKHDIGFVSFEVQISSTERPSLPRGLQFDQADVTELLRPILGPRPAGQLKVCSNGSCRFSRSQRAARGRCLATHQINDGVAGLKVLFGSFY